MHTFASFPTQFHFFIFFTLALHNSFLHITLNKVEIYGLDWWIRGYSEERQTTNIGFRLSCGDCRGQNYESLGTDL